MNPGGVAEGKTDADPRLAQITELLIEFAAGNLRAEAMPSARGDELDAIITGVVMLGQDLAHSFDALRAKTAELERANQSLRAELSEHRRTQERLRMTQEQFIQAQKMEVVGRLAGGVAHDFNNILTSIMSFAGLVKKELAPGTASRADMEEILRSAERAADLTRQLLTFARMKAPEARSVDVNALVQRMPKLLHRLLGEGRELRVATAPGPLPIQGDPEQIEQALINLVLNARDASPVGGRIAIETGTAEIAAQPGAGFPDAAPGNYAWFSVSDSGSGMTEEVKRHIFEPFFTTKAVGSGTGLGLAVVYGVVRQHKGFVTMESRPGQGATFRVHLPRALDGAARPGTGR